MVCEAVNAVTGLRCGEPAVIVSIRFGYHCASCALVRERVEKARRPQHPLGYSSNPPLSED
jgi:hypothetical protein